MRKEYCLIIFIILIFLSGCNDASVNSGVTSSKDPIEISTMAKGSIIQDNGLIEIEYTINEQDRVLNKLVISIIDSEDNVVKVITIDEEPLTEYVPDVELGSDLPDGSYILRLEFYDGEELYLTDDREFFITDASYFIRSITSYPPVLYPGGGGLFYADVESQAADCWLRWSLDGEQIAGGMKSEGYQSLRIDAPENEGVYELNLEVFPLPPVEGKGYDYESTLIKSIPFYVNKNQKSGANEFGADEDFYSLFHFRGSLINSADTERSGLESFTAIGKPALSVRIGVFGYSIDKNSGFKSDKLILPLDDEVLQSFSLMFSVIPGSLPAVEPSLGEGSLFYSGSADGSFHLAVDVLTDGQLMAEIAVNENVYQLVSGKPLLSVGVYSSIGLSFYPEDGQLNLGWYIDGVPVVEETFAVEVDSSVSSWKSIDTSGKIWKTSFGGIGGFEGLVDELGIYYQGAFSGPVIDPEQFRRSMKLEYGKFLMYAEGFDGKADDLLLHIESGSVAESKLIIAPGGHADFPPIFPGYEEIVFTIVLADLSTRALEVVFNPEEQDDEIVRVDLSSETDDSQLVNFSLIFSSEKVSVGETEAQDGETGFTGDFGGVVYQLINNDELINLEVESVLVIRKSINVSKADSENEGETKDGKPDITAGVNISS